MKTQISFSTFVSGWSLANNRLFIHFLFYTVFFFWNGSRFVLLACVAHFSFVDHFLLRLFKKIAENMKCNKHSNTRALFSFLVLMHFCLLWTLVVCIPRLVELNEVV